jgi:hypothetical protein
VSPECQHIFENIALFARSDQRLQADFQKKKTALEALLATTSKTFKAEADNTANIGKCTAASLAAPASVPAAAAPLAPGAGKEAFNISLSVNGLGCTGTPDQNCLKEFDIRRGKDAPTPPLIIVATMVGFCPDNYTLIIEGRHQTKECTGNGTCSWTVPGFKATDPIPAEDDFGASLKWLAKKDRQRDKGGAGSIVDGVAARVYVHYPN